MPTAKEIVTKQYRKKSRNLKKMRVGSSIRINTKIVEGGKERIQAFEGILIAKKGSGLDEMISVRKISFGGIGVERTFPLHAPMIDSIKVLKPGHSKRSKLYYLRDAFGRKAKREAKKFEAEVSAEQMAEMNAEAIEKEEEAKKEAEKKSGGEKG